MLELFMETKEQAQVVALENIWHKHSGAMQCSKLLEQPLKKASAPWS